MKRLLLLLLLSACTDGTTVITDEIDIEPPLVIDDLEITRPVPGASMSAGYFSLTNNTDTEVVITRVTSPQFGRVELHESTLEDGVAKMRRLDSLRVAPSSSIRLERGGKHLMLMQPGDNLGQVTLNLYSNDSIVLSVATSVAAR